MRLVLVVAATRQGVIGLNGGLPWDLPGDLKRFRELTMGKPILMGRRTWDSLPRRPLPGRFNLVLSRRGPEEAEDGGALWCGDLDQALALAHRLCLENGTDTLCVIGGADLFRLTLPLADVIHLTRVEADLPGDTRLEMSALTGTWPGPDWVEQLVGPLLEDNGTPYRYVDLVRA